MMITQVETFTVVVPVHEGAWHSPEYDPDCYFCGGTWVPRPWADVPIVVLRVQTDDGLTGLGEVSRGVPASAVHDAAHFFVGRELSSFNLQDLPMPVHSADEHAVYHAFEMVLFDLTGKVLSVPVYRLLGGKFRDWVPVSRCSGRMTPEDAAKTARKVVEQGYSVLKMKATADDPLVERLGAIQDAVGDRLQVVVDPNERFHQPFRLFALADRLRDAGVSNVQCYESPYSQRNLDWYVLARQKLTTPIALHLNQNTQEVIAAIKREACDWLNISSSLVTTCKMAAIAEAAGIPTWHGSSVPFGIFEASYAHVCAASRSMTLTSDICGETLRVNDLIREPLQIENGHLRVPEKPGLGIELDDDAVDRYRIA